MTVRPRRHTHRKLLVESLEARRVYTVGVTVPGPVVSAFTAFAEVSGLGLEVSDQTSSVLTIDSGGVRQVLREIDGVLYSVRDNVVYETSSSTGATQTRTLTPLSGDTKIEVHDVAQINGVVTFIGASLTVKGTGAGTPRATTWDIDGVPTAIGPENVQSKALFANADADLIGGYYIKTSGDYVPWLHSSSGDFDLPGAADSQVEQMITGSSSTGSFLYGYSGNRPMIWITDAAPQEGMFTLIESPETPMLLYPEGAVVGTAGKNFSVVELLNTTWILGQYDLPIINQGQITGYESHAAMWTSSGELEYDFGANSEMLGVKAYEYNLVVAHRDAISVIEDTVPVTVAKLPLNSLMPGLPPVGVTNRMLDDALVTMGDPGQRILGINFAQTDNGQTQNKFLVLPMKSPDSLDLDSDNDGVFESSFLAPEMSFPSFEPLGYGAKTLKVRVNYSDGSTAEAVTNFDSLRFEVKQTDGLNVLQVGGTAGNDTATISLLGTGSYRVNLAGQTRDFSNVDTVLANMAAGSDEVIFAGAAVINLSDLSGVETINLLDGAVQTINFIDPTSVGAQVSPGQHLLIKTNPDDQIDLLPEWTLEAPTLTDNRATARLSAIDAQLWLQTGLYTNPIDNLDVTFDNAITARDALLVINHINQTVGGNSPEIDAYLDVNGNGTITALDVLLIINHINTNGAGEGESSAELITSERAAEVDEQSALASDVELIAQTGKRRNR